MARTAKSIIESLPVERQRKIHKEADKLINTEKKRRGRPPGSKNKPKVITNDNDGLNPVVLMPRSEFRFRAASCGCEQTSLVFGAGMYCIHKNYMKLIPE